MCGVLTMVFKQKGKFTLDEQCLRKIVDNFKKQPQNQDVVIDIKKSHNAKSKSLYIRFYIDGYTTLLRISDHKCKGYVRNMIVSDSTGIANIYYKINSAIKDLRIKRVYGLLNKGA